MRLRRWRLELAGWLLDRAMPLSAPGVPVFPSSLPMPSAADFAPRARWYWSVCGRCGGQTRPGLPCGGCGWLLGSATPELVTAAGVDLADVEERPEPL